LEDETGGKGSWARISIQSHAIDSELLASSSGQREVYVRKSQKGDQNSRNPIEGKSLGIKKEISKIPWICMMGMRKRLERSLAFPQDHCRQS
jgi:hypothetical protein